MIDPRLPTDRLGLGVGFDLPWGSPTGLIRDPAGDRVGPRLAKFWDRHRGRFAVAFGSWQPRSRGRLDPDAYRDGWDDWWDRAGPLAARSLHHTTLNLASPEPRDLGPTLALTEALIARHGLRWVNEDLGLWSIHGHSLPYPLPPIATADGVATCVRNAERVNRALSVPLLLGFDPVVGRIDAYDLFQQVVDGSGCACTLDVGHLLSWRWRQGHRGEALLDDLDRLPLAACFELHLSGCAISGGRFYDAHHGLLLPEQLALLDQLLDRCPNLAVVTFEDPALDADGDLTPACAASLAAVEDRVDRWRASGASTPRGESRCGAEARTVWPVDVIADEGPTAVAAVERLWTALRAPDADGPAAVVRARGGSARTAGIGALQDAFPTTFAAHPDREALLAAFVASPQWEAVREVDGCGVGPCVEEAFAAFCAGAAIGDPATREAELLAAVSRALVIDPEPAFRVPTAFRRVRGGWLAVVDGAPARVFAAIDGRWITGALPEATLDQGLAESRPRMATEDAGEGVPSFVERDGALTGR
ncbi:MAG: DUF692 family multinuclear iron-containing protein [Myxococcota bacterium]